MTQRWCWPTGVYYVSEVLHLLRAQAGKPGDKCTWWCVHTALRAPALFISHICKHKTCSAESPGVQPKQNKTKNKQQKRAQIGLLVLCRQFLQWFAVRVSKECTWQHHLPVWQRYFSITYSNIISVCSDLNMLNYFSPRCHCIIHYTQSAGQTTQSSISTRVPQKFTRLHP